MLGALTIASLGFAVSLLGGQTDGAHDDCSQAPLISGQGVFAFDNSEAARDGPNHLSCGSPGNCAYATLHDVWYCWTSPFTDDVSVDTCGRTTVDTKIVIYEGCDCDTIDALCPEACSDDACATQSRATFSAVAGQSYLIRIGTAGDVDLSGGPGSIAIDYGDPSEGPQFPPICNGYIDVCQSGDAWSVFTSDRQHQVVADNFVPAVTGTIRDVCFWGTYLNDLGNWKDLSLDTFEVRYYENDGGRPGQLIGGPFEQLTGGIFLAGPALENGLLAQGQRRYRYSIEHAPVPVTAGQCYWLEITNDSNFLSQWQWQGSRRGDGLALQDGRLSDSPDGFDETDFVVSDMAFCLDIPLADTEVCYSAPPNDFCEDRTPIEEGVTMFDTIGATTDGPEVPLIGWPMVPGCAFPLGDDQVHGDIWFDFVAPCDGLLSIELCDSRFDTKVAVYDSDNCASLGDPIACNDDSCGAETGFQSQLGVEMDTGDVATIRVGGYFGATGPGGLDLTFNIQPPTTTDLSDYAGFTSCFTGSCASTPCVPPLYAVECCRAQDFDDDGDVDASDFTRLLSVLMGPEADLMKTDPPVTDSP